MTQERVHRRDLPWGWWLRQRDGYVEGADGKKWGNVRQAFWEGRLGFPSGHFAEEQQELLLRVLNAIDARWIGGGESRHDLFGGDMLFWRFYMCWLVASGLTVMKWPGTSLEATLSDEGHSGLLMLRATCDPDWIDLPFDDVVYAVRKAACELEVEAREAALRRFEGLSLDLPCRFARERMGRHFLVTLTSIDVTERMPTCRVTWSASFLDEGVRDDLFGWLAERVHRWEEWSHMAQSKGAHALSTHFMTLLVASPVTRLVGDAA